MIKALARKPFTEDAFVIPVDSFGRLVWPGQPGEKASLGSRLTSWAIDAIGIADLALFGLNLYQIAQGIDHVGTGMVDTIQLTGFGLAGAGWLLYKAGFIDYGRHLYLDNEKLVIQKGFNKKVVALEDIGEVQGVKKEYGEYVLFFLRKNRWQEALPLGGRTEADHAILLKFEQELRHRHAQAGQLF